MEIRHRTITANGLDFHIAEAGPDDGPLILLLHGFPEYWGTWKDVLPVLGAAGFHAVAPDQRGYNLSDKPSGVENYAAHHLVADILGIAKTLQAEPCILVAHDWGGAAAWAAAIAAPQAFTKLAILNAPHPALFIREMACSPEQRAGSQYMRLFKEPKSTRVLAENDFERLDKLVSWGSGAMTDNSELHAVWAVPDGLESMLNWYRAMAFDVPPLDAPYQDRATFRTPKMVVNVPTLVIWGDNDAALRRSLLDGIGEQVPELRIKHYPDASHWIVREYPEAVAADLLAFALS